MSLSDSNARTQAVEVSNPEGNVTSANRVVASISAENDSVVQND